MNESSSTAYQCSDCGKVMPQDMTHRCTSTAGENAGPSWLDGTGFINGIGNVEA